MDNMSLIKEEDIYNESSAVNTLYPIHIGPVFCCKFCKTNFINLDFLSRHFNKCKTKNIQILDKSKFDFLEQKVFEESLEKRKKGKNHGVALKNDQQRKFKSIKENSVENENRFKCEVCFKEFPWKYQLNRHIVIHSTEKPFQCEICFKQFNRKSNLQGHLIIHSGKKHFECKICSKQFKRKEELKKHFFIHSGEKPFQCEICSKEFSHKHHLKVHLYIHSGEKPFKCEICGKQFNQKNNLNTHLQHMHLKAKDLTT